MVGAMLLCAASLLAADYRAGVARLKITPEVPIRMAGYASRDHESEGVVHDLWAKALAIEDGKGGRVVFVGTDLIGFPRALSDIVAARAQKEYGLDRSQLVLNASHTHSGPSLRGNLGTMWELTAEETERINEYSQRLADALVTVIGAALGDLKPARLSFAEGSAGFAMNRREPADKAVRIGVNPQGPRDTAVPVLRITAPDGALRAVLFGYACHNTTLGGDFYKINGDYAGFAQIEIERRHPAATAVFFQLCGADQNPQPRGTLALAEQHGKTLAAEVERVLSADMRPVRGRIRSAFEVIEPAFAPHTREVFERELTSPLPAAVRRAKLMLKAYDDGRPVRRVPYPVQAVRLGKGLTLVALGGEVVVDYALRIKREFASSKEPLIVAGYSNDVMCYIPSAAVLRGGGYEPVESMIYYGMPGPFTPEIEDSIMSAVRNVLKRTGRR